MMRKMMHGIKKKLSVIGLGIGFLISGIFLAASPKNDRAEDGYERVFERGEAERLSGDYKRSIESFNEALAVSRKENDRTSEAACLMKLGILHWNIGSIKEATEYYTKALAVSRKADLKDLADRCRTVLEVIRLYLSGKRYRDSSDWRQSVESFKRAIDISRTMGSEDLAVKNLRQLGVTYREMNEHERSHICTEEALKIASNINNRREIAGNLNNLGIWAWNLANYSDALGYFWQALSSFKEAEDSQGEADCIYDIGLIHLSLGDYEKAISYCRQAMKMDRRNGERIELSHDFNILGIAFANLGRITKQKSYFQRAISCYDKCVTLLREHSNGGHLDRRAEMRGMINKANVFHYLGDFDRAASGLKLAYQKATEYGCINEAGVSINNLGLAEFEMGSINDAEKHFLDAVKIFEKTSDAQTLWESHCGLGRCYGKKGQRALAFRHYEASMDSVEGIRSRIPFDVFKVGFARNKIEVYEHALNLLYESKAGDPEEKFVDKMLSLVERAKARAFFESLSQAGTPARTGSPPAIPDKQYASAGTEMMRFVRKKLLDERTGLLEYFLGAKKSYLFYITRTKAELFELPPAADIEVSIKGYLKMLRAFDLGQAEGNPAAERIGRELLFPLFDAGAEDIKKLIIIPDGVLYYLPFEALRIAGEKDPRQKYLIEKYEVSYASSCASLVSLSERSAGARRKRLLAFGNPDCIRQGRKKGTRLCSSGAIFKSKFSGRDCDLSSLPYGRKEVLGIARHFTGKSRDVYLGQEADEETLKRAPLKDYKIIHFACHGLLDEDNPQRSGLVLSSSKNGKEDGFLQAREISDLRLNADLVVLSACRTARGSLEKREGILGLSRSFFCAGTKSVLSTLWEIRDKSSAVLMDRFYGYLGKGFRKAEALRQAKLRMIASKYAHPFYWAAFVLSGDPGPVETR